MFRKSYLNDAEMSFENGFKITRCLIIISLIKSKSTAIKLEYIQLCVVNAFSPHIYNSYAISLKEIRTFNGACFFNTGQFFSVFQNATDFIFAVVDICRLFNTEFTWWFHGRTI